MAPFSKKSLEGPFVLALDIGTSAVRAFLFDRWGRPVEGAGARRSYEIRTTTQGASEGNPDLLLNLTCRCIDRVMARSQALNQEVAGVGVCTFVGNILGVDERNRAITPIFTYADTRAEGEVAGLRAELDEEAVHDRTGCHFHPAYLPAFFRWFARAKPELFRQVARWVTLGEYLELKLFGETSVSYSVASWSGLLDRRRLVWDQPLLAALPVRAGQLSPLMDPNVPRRGLRPEFASRWPGLSRVPWFPAIGDGAAANIGSGCVSPDRIALTMGTTTALRAVIEHPVDHIPPGLWCYRVDGRRSLPGGALSEGGSVFAWMRENLKLGEPAQVEAALATMEPDGHGLTILPFFAGERSPGFRGDARATLHGLSLATSSIDIVRASLEAVAFRIALVYDLLRPLLPKDPEIVAGGGALLSSPAWLQIITDVLGRPIAASEVKEVSARGVAILALEALGLWKDLTEGPHFIGRTYRPNMDRHTRYLKAMDRQRFLYERMMKP